MSTHQNSCRVQRIEQAIDCEYRPATRPATISATSAQHQRSHAGPAQARYAASGSAHICDLIADLQRALAVLRAMV